MRTKKRYCKAVGVTLLLAVLFVTLSSALLCDTTVINKQFNYSINTSPVNFTCFNSANNSVAVSTSGDLISVYPSAISSNTSQSIQVNFQNNTPVGNTQRMIMFSDGSNSILVNISVSNNNVAPPINYSDVIVFPTSKLVGVQKGNKKTTNIQVIVPANYPRVIRIQSTSFDPDIDIASFGDLNLGNLNPGQTLDIPVTIDATNAQLGTYNTKVTILATDSNGQVLLAPSNLQITVTSGTSPVTNETFTTKPTCSLSANTLIVNNTYTFTCSNLISNLDINVPYNSYIEGKSVDITSGVYSYQFKPIKYGSTNFTANFLYKSASIFSPFTQDIRVQGAGGSTLGTNLKLLFTPELSIAKNKQEVIVQVVDNLSGSLVPNSELYMDAYPVNSTYNSFKFAFEANKNYSVRARADGYEDLLKTIWLTSIPIEITVNPNSGDSSDTFNITTNAENASLYINGNKVDNPYFGSLSAGNNTIRAIKEGYVETNLTFLVDSAPFATLGTEFKKGVNQNIFLNKELNWSVLYGSESSNITEKITNGFGKEIQFNPDSKGFYSITSGNKTIAVYEIKGWDGKMLGITWYWYLAVVFIIGVFIYARKSGGDTVTGLTGEVR